MKIIPFVVLLVLIGRGCKDEVADINQATLKYQVHSRGFYRDVLVANKEVSVSGLNGVNLKTETIDDATWKAFQKAFADLNAEEMHHLKAPSNQRLYDGAAIAKLGVTYKGKSFESIDFDHGTPPAEIEKLVNLMAAYVNREE